MASPLIFQLDSKDTAGHLNEVDQSKLSSHVDQQVLDESDASCELATLALGGQTLIGSGGTIDSFSVSDHGGLDSDVGILLQGNDDATWLALPTLQKSIPMMMVATAT